MATATITGLTNITNAENTTGWNSLGGGPGASLTNDIFIQGNGAIGRRGSTGGRGFYFTTGTGIDFTVADRYLWMWINIPLAPGGLDLRSNGGLSIIAGTGATNYNLYHVGGGDVTTTGWKRYLIDLNQTASGTNGAGATLTNIDTFGIFTNWLTVPGGNIPHYVVDSIDYGGTLDVTGGTTSDRLTWEDVYIYSDGTPTTRVLGAVQKFGGVYYCNGLLNFGSSGANDCYFQDEGQTIIFENQEYYNGASLVPSLPASATGISVQQGSGITEWKDGVQVASGDDASGRNGSLIRTAAGSVDGFGIKIDFTNPNVNSASLYGTQIVNAPDGVEFSSGSNGSNFQIYGTSFANTSQVLTGRAQVRGTTFSGYELDTTKAALLWNENIDIVNSSFLGNASGSLMAAVEHNFTGSFDYNNLTFAGNDFDIRNTSGGPVTASVLGGSTPSFTNSGSSTTLVLNSKQLSLTGIVSQSEVRIYSASLDSSPPWPELTGVESLNGTQFNYTYNYTSDTDIIIVIHKEDYEYFSLETTLINGNSTIPISQIFDRNYSNS